jgi:hypothetical protein
MPSGSEWNDEIRTMLSRPLGDQVHAWTGELHRYRHLHGTLPDVLAAETEAIHAVLREIARHPNFCRALSQASPALFEELDKWLADERRRPRRQSLVRLAKYVARAAGKTSPHSTFTFSGTGTWVCLGPALRYTGTRSARTVLELDGMLLSRLSRAFMESPRLSESLRVRANPSVTLHGDSASFVGPPPREPIVTVPATSAVRTCLRILGDGTPRTMRELRDQLTTDSADEEKAWRFLCALAEAGFLERQVPVADQAVDPLGDLSTWLADGGGGSRPDAAALVERVRDCILADHPIDDVAGHRARLHALDQAVAGLAATAGLTSELASGWVKGVSRENAIFAQPFVECGTPHWRPALEDLDAVRRWLAVFDPTLPLRLALGAYCREHFGAGSRVPLLLVHRALQEQMQDSGSADQTAAARDVTRLLRAPQQAVADVLDDSRLPRQRELAQMRLEAQQSVSGQADADGIVRVESALMAELAASWPAWVRAPRSFGCYVQVVADGAAVRLVINVAHGGYGRGRTRVLRMIQQGGGVVPPYRSWNDTAGGALLAELSGLFDSTLNQRLAATPYEIDYPVTVSTRPTTQQIRLADLEVVHEPRSDMVRLSTARRLADVHPLHLGMMADILLPPVARLMSQAFGANYYLHPGIPLLTPYNNRGPLETIVASPRIEIGRVVIQRARWIVPAACVPVRGKGESDAAYLVSLLTWLRAHDIPARCFIRMLSGNPGTGESATRWEQTWILDKSHKPVYVDFANLYLVMAFERMFAKGAWVMVFEEVLPLPEGSGGPVPGDPCATEFLIEISERNNNGA